MDLAKLFKVTLIITIVALLIEGSIFLAIQGTQKADYHVFEKERELQSATKMERGIFFLALVPLVIALGGFFMYLFEKEFLYVAITLILIAILFSSLLVN